MTFDYSQSAVDNNLLEEYQMLYHPLVVDINNQQKPLLDLFFFYLQKFFNDETIKCELVNKTMQVFKKFKNYFLMRLIALLLCKTDVSPD